MKVVLSCKKRLKKLRILVLHERDLITATFSIKFKVILPPPLYKYARVARCLFIICVIVYNLYYCCYAKTSSSAVSKKSQQSVRKPYRPLLLFNIFLLETKSTPNWPLTARNISKNLDKIRNGKAKWNSVIEFFKDLKQ